MAASFNQHVDAEARVVAAVADHGSVSATSATAPALSSCAPCEGPIIVPAFMRLSLWKRAVFVAGASSLFICSCEKHHTGEMPEVQKEHVDLASESGEASPVDKERSTSPPPSVRPTPAEFFPESSPR